MRDDQVKNLSYKNNKYRVFLLPFPKGVGPPAGQVGGILFLVWIEYECEWD